ncbi:hypothetical protein HZA73_06705 [candidate division TA06 bacterium]|nr:hypothetical protein [candidate division TA06 bacterium]
MNRVKYLLPIILLLLITYGCNKNTTIKESYKESIVITGDNGSGYGQLLWSDDEMGQPVGPVSFDINGNRIFIIDNLNERINIYDTNGVFHKSLKLMDYMRINDIAVGNGKYYLRYDNRILVFDNQNDLLDSIKFKKTGSISLLELLANGNIITQNPENRGEIVGIVDHKILPIKTNVDYFVETRGIYYLPYTVRHNIYQPDSLVYSTITDDKINIKSIGKVTDVIGIDSANNIYAVIGNDSIDYNKIVIINPKGIVLNEINIPYDYVGHSTCARSFRVTQQGDIYILRGWKKEKYKLYRYCKK